jgi:transcription antitermination factor NusG
MEKNWYVVCTKQQQEKKVSDFLEKKGIETFCPFTYVKRSNGTQSVTASLPLFRTYVFVKVTQDQIIALKNTANIINTVYWKSKPVMLQQDEIAAIKQMSENYQSIKLERTNVGINTHVGVLSANANNHHRHHTLSIKPLLQDVTIPSLGYRMVGQRGNIKRAIVPKKPSVVSNIAKRLNPALLFGL